MAYSMRECLKKLKEVAATSDQRSAFEEALKDTNDKHLPTQSALKKDFLAALEVPLVLEAIRKCMVKYHSNKNIKIKDGLFPKFTETQTNTVRIALFMVSACTQQILHAMSNPDQSRAALDNAETRVVAARTEMFNSFTAVVNSSQAPDHPIVDMLNFNGIMVDTTHLLGPSLTMLQVATSMRDIKREMSILMRNFNQSGHLENGADDFDRDVLFYDNFAKGDAVMFAIYLAWDHGRNMPPWNSTLLPAEMQLDLGAQTPAAQSTSSAQKRARVSSPPDIVDPEKLTQMIDMQSRFFEYALGGQRSGATVSTDRTVESGVKSLAALRSQLALLKELRQDENLDASQMQKVKDKYDKVVNDICSLNFGEVVTNEAGRASA